MLRIVRPLINRYRKSNSISGILVLTAFLFVFMISFSSKVLAQDEPLYDEITVFLNIQKVGGIDIPAVILDETVFLPIVDIFSILKIKNTPSAQLDSVTGFFINQQATYFIDKRNNRITYQGKIYDLKSEDMIKTETNLYLRSPFFGQIFGLDCSFSFRNLSVLLNTKLELPIIREMRLEQMRSNVSRLKGEVKTDTTIGRKYPIFHFGVADWSVISTQQLQGQIDARVNLALGTVLAGGEANVLLNYNNNSSFSEKQQQYIWKFVNNERKIFRQVMVGKINTQVTSSIYDPIVGVQFTNTPTSYRRSFGSYSLSDITEPNWTVELYINNVLIDYMKADASGFYKFEVPLVYGNSSVKLKFYGPWGEERIKEDNIIVPFNFLPLKEFEYTVSAGLVEDTLRSRFSRATFNYGISRKITLGGGVEYLSSVNTGQIMPFMSASVRLLSGLLVTGEYTYAVRAKGILSYRLPSNLQFELNYIKYDPGQKAIIYNYLEERKAAISIPITGKDFTAYSRLTLNQIVLPNLKNTNAEMLLSGSVFGVSTNFTTYGLFTDLSKPYLYSNLSLSFRLPTRISVTPQVQYEYNSNQLISARASFEKPLFKKGFLNMSYEQNFRNGTRSIELGFRYDLSFTQAGFSIRNTNDQTSMVETARGSLLYNSKTQYIGANNRTSVGKGAITIFPFLDINGNRRRDIGEPKAPGLQVRINGGTIIRNERDTTISIFDLTPYTNYVLELDRNSFDNISWQMKFVSLKVMIDPNQFKIIEVPISVMGEATGNVYLGQRGQGRILVCFYRSDKTLAARTLTESDGYYSYLGLTPGNYTVRIDPEQLKKLQMVSSPEVIPITFSSSSEGDIVDGLDFKLKLIKEPSTDTTSVVSPVGPVTPATVLKKDADIPLGKVKTEPVTIKTPSVVPTTPVTVVKTPPVAAKPATVVKTSPVANNISLPAIKAGPSQYLNNKLSIVEYEGEVIQICAVKIKSVAFEALKKIEEVSRKHCIVVYEEGYYKVRISGFANREIARQFASSLSKSWFEIFYIPVIKPNVSIQVGEYSKENEALVAQKKWADSTGKQVIIIYSNDLYKVRIPGFVTNGDALDFKMKF